MQSIDLQHNTAMFVGAFDFDQTDTGITPRRLPAFTRLRMPEEMHRVVSTPSGVRIEFQSDTTEIEIDVHLSIIMAGRAIPNATIDLTVDGELVQSQSHNTGDIIRYITMEKTQTEPGPAVCFKFTGLTNRSKRIALWLPVNAMAEVRDVRIDEGASFDSVAEILPRWIHHGSSISHCSEAASPTQTWPAVAAGLSRLSLTSLGFGGQCHLDPFVAQTIRDLPADYISLKVGINIVNQNSLGRRTFASMLHGFLDIIREGQPNTPIILISPIFCPFSEDVPGPTIASIKERDGQKRAVFGAIQGHDEVRQNSLTLTQMRTIISDLVIARQAAGDTALEYVDGLALFGVADQHDLPDDLHPNAAGYIRMGERFAAIAFGNL